MTDVLFAGDWDSTVGEVATIIANAAGYPCDYQQLVWKQHGLSSNVNVLPEDYRALSERGGGGVVPFRHRGT